MTDHEAELATLHQEAVQQRARIKRLEAALRRIAHPDSLNGAGTPSAAWKIASEALQEAGQ